MDAIDTTLKDEEIIPVIIAGDTQLFRVLVDRYKDNVYCYVYRLVHNPVEAEDIVAETFLRAFKSLNRYNPKFQFNTWLFTIAANLTKNLFKHRQRVVVLPLDKVPDEEGNSPPELNLPDKESNTDTLTSDRTGEIVKQVLGLLPGKYRLVFTLRYIQGCSYEEICEATKLPLGTVKTYLFRSKTLILRKTKLGTEF